MDLKFYDESEVQLVNHCVSDEWVARAAWVSTVGEESRFKDTERMGGLIEFLMRDRHGSPFEHGSMTFFVKTPLFVRSEFHRHRIGWSYNEESGRYSEMKAHFYLPNEDRNLVQTGKPGAYIFGPGTEEQYDIVKHQMLVNASDTFSSYREMLDAGVAKEVARMVLPLNLMTSFYATCNARSLMSFLSLRVLSEDATYPSHPQWEIHQVASKLEAAFKELMPVTHESFVRNGRVSP